ncbi:hypothetical protein ACFVT1_27090 [Streptomyces sp. NPDC057963]|uniref:hypothetical protein n=1 Tax=Streptomyces sp. NPDC057963 TaxID=3346290 RepID=UPI0036ED1B7F
MQSTAARQPRARAPSSACRRISPTGPLPRSSGGRKKRSTKNSQRTARPRSLSASGRQQALARARLCYDHLAGAVALAITDAMVGRGLLEWGPEPGLTSGGAAWPAEVGITVPSGSRRPLVRACLDWTERRPHLAGAVGAALCSHALTAGWVTRIGTTRAFAVTATGGRAWHDHLGLPPADL